MLANQQEAIAMGVSSTPTFYINGYPLRGAQSYDVFSAVAELVENGELEAVLEAQMRQAYQQAQAQAAQPQPPTGPVDAPHRKCLRHRRPETRRLPSLNIPTSSARSAAATLADVLAAS